VSINAGDILVAFFIALSFFVLIPALAKSLAGSVNDTTPNSDPIPKSAVRLQLALLLTFAALGIGISLPFGKPTAALITLAFCGAGVIYLLSK